LRARLLPSADKGLRAEVTAGLDSLADNLEIETASRGKKSNWLCPSLTGWANGLEGSVFVSLTESQFRAELIRHHCPLWLAKLLAVDTFQLLPAMKAAIGKKSSISLIVRLFAVWACPIQERCVSYRENIFKLTFEGILAPPGLGIGEVSDALSAE